MVDDWHRARLFDALSQAVLADARPLLLVVEDLQWCDQDTLGWLGYLLASSPHAPVLAIGTARTEDVGPEHALRRSLLPAARAYGRAVDFELTPLDPDETATLAVNVSGSPLDDVRAERLHRETEGNPLFVVEWVRAGLTEEPLDEDRVSDGDLMPPGARAVIEARLAQLSTAGQELAGLAATLGRAFTFDLLTLASSQPEERVVEALDELWRRRIVRERGSDAYDFSHDKLREVAYRRVSPARRRFLHSRVAQAMERLHAADLNGVSGELAAHYEQGGWTDRAIDFYARAATVAQAVYANEEAIGLLSHALALLDEQPPSRERSKRELKLRTALGVALVVLTGYGTPEVTATYARAMEICAELDEPPTAPVLRGTGLSALVRGELPLARDTAMRLLELGERHDDSMVQAEGHYLRGVTLFWLGDLTTARDQLERAIAVYAPERSREHLAFYSQDPRVVCLSRLSYTLWHLGDSRGASRHCMEALRLAEQLEHPFSLGYALAYASWLAIDSGDEPAARRQSARLAELAEEQQLGFLQPLGTILSGWRDVSDGHVDAGITMIHEGLDLYRHSGQSLLLPWSLRLLTEVNIATGRIVAARVALTEAFEVVEATEQRFLEADLHRLSGELVLLEGGDAREAESSFDAAVEVARSQRAVQFELRANASLERLRSVNQ
jgi:predicted ATPase